MNGVGQGTPMTGRFGLSWFELFKDGFDDQDLLPFWFNDLGSGQQVQKTSQNSAF
jgi:hypothetical protein